MARSITQRELRNESGEIMRALDRGESFVVTRNGRRLSEDAVKQYALANAPAFQHPRHVVFVPELPLASTGKVDRVALRRLALQHLHMETKA